MGVFNNCNYEFAVGHVMSRAGVQKLVGYVPPTGAID